MQIRLHVGQVGRLDAQHITNAVLVDLDFGQVELGVHVGNDTGQLAIENDVEVGGPAVQRGLVAGIDDPSGEERPVDGCLQAASQQVNLLVLVAEDDGLFQVWVTPSLAATHYRLGSDQATEVGGQAGHLSGQPVDHPVLHRTEHVAHRLRVHVAEFQANGRIDLQRDLPFAPDLLLVPAHPDVKGGRAGLVIELAHAGQQLAQDGPRLAPDVIVPGRLGGDFFFDIPLGS